MRDRKTRVGNAERIDPSDFGIEPEDLPEREDDADAEHRDDQAVQPGVGLESALKLGKENGADETDQREEDQHPDQETRRASTATGPAASRCIPSFVDLSSRHIVRP